MYKLKICIYLIVYLFFAFIAIPVSSEGNIDNSGDSNMEKATFAGGCFWCMEPPFDNISGVIDVVAGYTGGNKENPSYDEVSSGKTGHLEAVQVTYDPSRISYSELLDIFWNNINPVDDTGQFADKGSQYKTAIFYHDNKQKLIAEKSKIKLQESGIFNKPIATSILKASKFYKAEDYHQNFYKTCPERYEAYKKSSGRAEYLENMHKNKTAKPHKNKLKNILTPIQYEVTQECGTEPPFKNEYWNNKKEGIYVDIISGEPLFASTDKYDSGTGWPSFTKPIDQGKIIEKDDLSLPAKRIEVRSKASNSHLGHVFNDGPNPTGKRYCINSAALRFIPKEDLEKEGYAKYAILFQ